MKDQFGFKQLILLSIFYLAFTLIKLALDDFTGIHWTSPRDLNAILGWIAVALLWVWYIVDKLRKK